MKELNKALDISLHGPEADAALSDFLEQIRSWGIALPQVEPLIADLGLGRFREIGLIEYWIANEEEAGYCGKYLFVFDGQTCPMHRHKVKTETFFIVKGRVRMEFDGASSVMNGARMPVMANRMTIR